MSLDPFIGENMDMPLATCGITRISWSYCEDTVAVKNSEQGLTHTKCSISDNHYHHLHTEDLEIDQRYPH